jgi:hypothetical protein
LKQSKELEGASFGLIASIGGKADLPGTTLKRPLIARTRKIAARNEVICAGKTMLIKLRTIAKKVGF